MILCIRTDTAVVELSLFNAEGDSVAQLQKELGKTMAKNILACLGELLKKQKIEWQNLQGVIVYQGPGSFTGLRIGITVANTVAYSEHVPIIGERGEDWIAHGLKRLADGENDKIVLPFYGREAHITTPKK